MIAGILELIHVTLKYIINIYVMEQISFQITCSRSMVKVINAGWGGETNL